ncbi:type IV secretory system conjugative DNA transfer family protein [Blastococcus sp. SYSU DS0617]
MASWAAGRGARSVARGRIGPWDPVPPAGSTGYLDFSGAARPGDVDCRDWWFPLGRYVKPKNPWAASEEIGLSMRQANRHTLVLGPTRGGKTAGVIAPWIVAGAQAGYQVVTVDVKGGGDLLGEVRAYRDAVAPGEKHRLLSWDYRNPGASKQWNFFAELDDEGAVNAAAEALCGRARDNDPHKNFHLRDLKWMRGLLELVYDSNLDVVVRDVLVLLADPTALRNLIARHPASRGAQRLRDLCQLSDDEFAKATQFLSTYLEVLNTDGFNAVTRRSQLDMRTLATDAPAIVHVNAPIVDRSLSEAASGLFLSQLLHRRMSRFGQASAPMLLVLDEAPRLQDRLDLGSLLSLAAGANVSVLLAAQDIDQFDKEKRQEILANCGSLVLLAGANSSTTDYVMSRLGTRLRGKTTRADSLDHQGRSTSYTRDSETVPVLDHAALRHPPAGRFGATLLNDQISQRPVLIDLTRPDLSSD